MIRSRRESASGWTARPNHDLNPGAIIALSPALTADKKAVYNSWGPGKYDPRYNQDGMNGPQVIPPAYGLLGVNKITSTGDGDTICSTGTATWGSPRWAATARSWSRAPVST